MTVKELKLNGLKLLHKGTRVCELFEVFEGYEDEDLENATMIETMCWFGLDDDGEDLLEKLSLDDLTIASDEQWQAWSDRIDQIRAKFA